MITERIGDLLDQKDLTHIAHQANLGHTFGAGLALQIGRRFPYATDADRGTPLNDRRKLGTYSIGVSPDGDGPNIVNLYSQDGWSTDYSALHEALTNLEEFLRPSDRVAALGLPRGLGCGIANGSWERVRRIIDSVFAESSVRVVICELPVGGTE